MRHSLTILALACGLLMGLAAQPASAQGPRWRKNRQERIETAAQREKSNKGGGREGNNVRPNARGMEGMPGQWVGKLRDMSPEDQRRFMENNRQFQNLPPQRQEQIRRNLERWNSLTPEQREEARRRGQVLEQMTPEQREYVRGTLLPKWQQMPIERRQAINRHLAILRNMSPATQQAALDDPQFMQGLSPDDQSMLRELNSLRNPSPQ